MAPPLVYLLTAATYVASTWAIWRIRTPEPTPVRSDATLGAQIREGLAFVRGQRILYPLFSCIAAAAFANAGIRVLLPLLVLRTLSMSATQLGLLLSAGAIGGFLGALTRPVWIAHLGIGRTLVITNIIGILVIVAQPASIHAPGMAAWIIAVSGVASSYFLTVYNVTQMSLRQEICPPDMLGRMNAIFASRSGESCPRIHRRGHHRVMGGRRSNHVHLHRSVDRGGHRHGLHTCSTHSRNERRRCLIM